MCCNTSAKCCLRLCQSHTVNEIHGGSGYCSVSGLRSGVSVRDRMTGRWCAATRQHGDGLTSMVAVIFWLSASTAAISSFVFSMFARVVERLACRMHSRLSACGRKRRPLSIWCVTATPLTAQGRSALIARMLPSWQGPGQLSCRAPCTQHASQAGWGGAGTRRKHLVLLVALLLQARLSELRLPQLDAPLLLQECQQSCHLPTFSHLNSTTMACQYIRPMSRLPPECGLCS